MLVRKSKESIPHATYRSYDEKPGIQAISSSAPDLIPKVGKYCCIVRDYEYLRHGTLISLFADINLFIGRVVARFANVTEAEALSYIYKWVLQNRF